MEIRINVIPPARPMQHNEPQCPPQRTPLTDWEKSAFLLFVIKFQEKNDILADFEFDKLNFKYYIAENL